MTGRSHLVIGTVSAAAGTAALGCSTVTASIVITGAIATATLPDIDTVVMRRDTIPQIIIGKVLRALGLRHRGITHTAIACLLAAAAVGIGLSLDSRSAPYALTAAAGVLVGYGMHLVADACTPHGVPALAPFCRRDLHLLPRPMRIEYGSRREVMIVALMTIMACLLTFHVYA